MLLTKPCWSQAQSDINRFSLATSHVVWSSLAQPLFLNVLMSFKILSDSTLSFLRCCTSHVTTVLRPRGAHSWSFSDSADIAETSTQDEPTSITMSISVWYPFCSTHSVSSRFLCMPNLHSSEMLRHFYKSDVSILFPSVLCISTTTSASSVQASWVQISYLSKQIAFNAVYASWVAL